MPVAGSLTDEAWAFPCIYRCSHSSTTEEPAYINYVHLVAQGDSSHRSTCRGSQSDPSWRTASADQARIIAGITTGPMKLNKREVSWIRVPSELLDPTRPTPASIQILTNQPTVPGNDTAIRNLPAQSARQPRSKGIKKVQPSRRTGSPALYPLNRTPGTFGEYQLPSQPQQQQPPPLQHNQPVSNRQNQANQHNQQGYPPEQGSSQNQYNLGYPVPSSQPGQYPTQNIPSQGQYGQHAQYPTYAGPPSQQFSPFPFSEFSQQGPQYCRATTFIAF